ncbi:MAG: restriction endonuclease subunit S [Verrucomicrobiales bacterium]|nr:restriction endonuclease subunit S [Verrucomicrobiales bacterium]
MKKGWTEVALGEVLTPRSEVCEINPEGEYREVTVSLWGKGVRLRRKVAGSEIAAQTRNVARTGDFIISKIDARHGAYGFIPTDLDGAVVTNDFPLFSVVEKTAHPRWLYWVSRSAFFVELCRASSEGTTNRVRLKESKFAEVRIPLPPLAEQQRLVAHLDAIESRLTRAQQLGEEQDRELQAALRSAFHRLEAAADWKPMVEVAPVLRRPTEIELDGEYPELGARSFGKGIFHKPALSGASLTWQKLFQVHAGDIVISNIKAWEGAIAVAGKQDHGRYGSHRYLTCVTDPNLALPEFICFYLLSSSGLEQVGLASPGSADRNRTLAVGRLERIKVPILPLAEQREFKKLLDLQLRIRDATAQSGQLVASLLPSLLDRIFNRET